ncbi:MAG: ShlB/FhaC/HecB family hemolysin secretion/activation protein, partial [Tardiphaga sp.]
MQIVCFPAQAQHANQPGYDPRQTERRFEDQQSVRSSGGRPRLPMPQFARTAGKGDSKPLFVLQSVS